MDKSVVGYKLNNLVTHVKKQKGFTVRSDALPYEFSTSERISIDYVNHKSSLKNVFPKHFRESRVREFNVNRVNLVDKLLEYNKKIGAPKQVVKNINSLSHPETYAVITGQQPGLFSGPLYTVYKAVSTIVICEKLSNAKHLFVPIFWNASEDHDFSEVNRISLFKKNNLYSIHYDSVAEEIAFSHLSLDQSELNRILAVIESVSPESEFKALLLAKLREITEKSSTVGEFFSRFMVYLFGELGLVLMEPQHFRHLMTPVFDKLIRSPTQCTAILNEAGSELRKLGYSPKIHKKPGVCNFFLLSEGGKRLRISYNGKFQIGGETFSQKDLLDLLDDNPSRFSANALTRPITQDFLFPTAAYVAGPSEIAYQAQIKGIYDFFSLEMPVIFPRFGATVVEKKIAKVLLKHKIEIFELKTPAKLLKDLAKKKIDGVFDSFRNEVSRNMSAMIRQASIIDQDLIEPCLQAKGRILKTIQILEDKMAKNLKKQNQIARRQIVKAHNNLFPSGRLQERQINVLEYLIKFGKQFLKTVHKSFVEADYGEHTVIKC
ncbi:MAG: bacillithiol biosynthesis cysteine-adding enzyme BshC [Candidatus Bathyarchaeota archaeon]|nr:MAG: bacillithiol biosynthesis cysteine-adding enzyme BshC [Candidatus Bathyarchaeota archaeon]